MITLIAIKNTSMILMQSSCFLSSISFTIFPLIKSSVSVELDVSTKDDKVDMDAESTNTITIPTSISERDDSIVGIIAS